jgi:hypothetical protein
MNATMAARIYAAGRCVKMMEEGDDQNPSIGELLETMKEYFRGIVDNPDVAAGYYIGMAWALDGCPGLVGEERELLMTNDYVARRAE